MKLSLSIDILTKALKQFGFTNYLIEQENAKSTTIAVNGVD